MCQTTTNRGSVRRLCLPLSDLGFRILGLGLQLGNMIERKLSGDDIANLRIGSILNQILTRIPRPWQSETYAEIFSGGSGSGQSHL